jgi:hypothetical protein
MPTDQYTPLACACVKPADSAQAPAARADSAQPRAKAEVRLQWVFKDSVFMVCSWLQGSWCPVSALQKKTL